MLLAPHLALDLDSGQVELAAMHGIVEPLKDHGMHSLHGEL